MTVFDELAETDGDEELKAWLSKVIDGKQEIVAFVARHRQQQDDKKTTTAEFDSYLKGSFNLSLVVRFVNDENGLQKALIRFPKPGYTATARRDEKVRNEVQVLRYLAEKTTIPVPRVYSWGTTEESPGRLGPFMIMEYVAGTSLATILMQPTPTDQDEVILASDLDDAKLDYVYEQLADYMLQLYRLDFTAIGAIAKDPRANEWTVSGRPLTYNMNELQAVVSDYPTSHFSSTPFTSAREFLHSLADEHLVHLKTQRNLANGIEDAKKRFIARHQFKQLVSRYCLDDDGPFKLYCDDLQPTNMLADPNTFRITAVLDFEFTNAMPAQFASDPPWWLLLLGPDMWLENHTFEEFTARYVPRMEQFLKALEQIETRTTSSAEEGGQSRTTLSALMRDSWSTGRFWFDYGIRKSFDVDAVYWAALHKDGDCMLSKDLKDEMDKLVSLKMEQLKEYDAECKRRFS